MRDFIRLIESVQIQDMCVDDLPMQTKHDIVDMLIEQPTGFADSYKETYGEYSLRDENVFDEIFDVGCPIRVNVFKIDPMEIDNTNRGVSDDVVSHYQTLKTMAPPVLIRQTENGWKIVEGGHRLAAAKANHTPLIQAVDVTEFFETDWSAYIDGTDNH